MLCFCYVEALQKKVYVYAACLKGLDPIYVVSYYIDGVKISWTHGNIRLLENGFLNI